MNMKLLKCFFATGLLLLSIGVQAELVVIVHPSSNVSSISKSELGKIFLGKASEFSAGGKAIPINQILASSTRKEFDSNILNKSEAQIKSYWSRQLFSGEGTPPDEVNGDLDMLQKISQTPGSIGYIDSSALNDGVKAVQVN